jgi:hypothetical protein
MPNVDWKKYDPLLGTNSDAAIAREIGCTKLAVMNRRLKLRRPSWLEAARGAAAVVARKATGRKKNVH